MLGNDTTSETFDIGRYRVVVSVYAGESSHWTLHCGNKYLDGDYAPDRFQARRKAFCRLYRREKLTDEELTALAGQELQLAADWGSGSRSTHC
jgi:hypothetical protein